MKPGRALSVLTGVALLGAIAEFNEMTPDAQAALLDSAAETAQTTAQSLLAGAVTTYNDLTEKVTGAATPEPVRVAAAPQASGDGKNAQNAPQHVAARTAEADQPSGNPLWVLPIKQLTSTRDRPIFSPSRRPPPPPTPTYIAPVAVRQPVKPPEPERPKVSLLGTIIGTGATDGIGVFLETGTQNVLRLRVGEDHHGWVLRLVKAREVTLVKGGEEAVVLAMPAPGEGPVPAMAGGTTPGFSPPPVGMSGIASTVPLKQPPPTKGRRR